MEFANVNFMQLLPSKVISPEIETAMKECGEISPCEVTDSAARNRQRQTNCVALPPEVYTQQHNFNKDDLMTGLAN